MLSYATVKGRRLAYEVEGTGTPPIVFVSGAADDHHVWRPVLDHLPATTAQLTYDRFGVGKSGGPPAGSTIERTVTAAAEELADLVEAIRLPSPRILVGHSLGALMAYLYASRAPHDCVGLVLVDASDARTLSKRSFGLTINDNPQIAYSWRTVANEVDVAPVAPVPTRIVTSAVGRWLFEREPQNYQPFTRAEMDRRWHDWQHTLADRLRTSAVAAPDSGHQVHLDKPLVVATAIEDLLMVHEGR